MSLKLSPDILENIKQIDQRTKTVVAGYIHRLQRTLKLVDFSDSEYTILATITLFYYIDNEKSLLFSNIYNMFLDPEFCGIDIELSQWYSSVQHNLHFTGNQDQEKQIFDYMDSDRDGWVHKSDFVIFTTSHFQDKKMQKLQTLLLNAIDTDIHSQKYIDIKHRADSSRKQRLSKLDKHCQMVRCGIIPRLQDEAQLFDGKNVRNWVIHQVINWMDHIGMEKYSKCFVDYERPMSGQRILNYKNIYQFRLEIDFEIDTFDALYIVQQIDTLRTLLPKDDKNIDYVEEAKWLQGSFRLLNLKYFNDI